MEYITRDWVRIQLLELDEIIDREVNSGVIDMSVIRGKLHEIQEGVTDDEQDELY